ncbi:MAG: nitronate monooxygenase [Pseudomonadota bacterium]
MNSKICEMLGIEFPLLAFSHCRDVVAAVSKAGGMGVFGAVMYTPEQLREELAWIDAHCNGKPYGLDLIVPNKILAEAAAGLDEAALLAALPQEQLDFVAARLQEAGIEPGDLRDQARIAMAFAHNLNASGAEEMLEVAFSFPIKLVANALGAPPPVMFDFARTHDVPVAALVGAKEHALKQLEAGVDILIASGGEAGGHCGDVATMVLVPEVVSVAGDTPVLAAGGIVRGDQRAAAMAMGAAGAWCGSVWLTTAEAEPSPTIKHKLLEAGSRDTVRSRSRTGKFSRQLRSPWVDAWEAENAPEPLPMPLQSLVTEPALAHIAKLAEGGHAGAASLATYWVGQGVGLMTEPLSAGEVVQHFKRDFITAYERLSAFIGV